MPATSSLSPQQVLAAQSLSLGQSQGVAAQRAGVTRVTVCRWLKLPLFQQKLEELKREIQQIEGSAFTEAVEEVKKNIKQSTSKILAPDDLKLKLTEIIEDPDTSTSLRLKAIAQLGKWFGLDQQKPTSTQGENDFPVELGSDLPDFSQMSDEELQQEYLKTLADD